MTHLFIDQKDKSEVLNEGMMSFFKSVKNWRDAQGIKLSLISLNRQMNHYGGRQALVKWQIEKVAKGKLSAGDRTLIIMEMRGNIPLFKKFIADQDNLRKMENKYGKSRVNDFKTYFSSDVPKIVAACSDNMKKATGGIPESA